MISLWIVADGELWSCKKRGLVYSERMLTLNSGGESQDEKLDLGQSGRPYCLEKVVSCP